jgi:hypothetical protein
VSEFKKCSKVKGGFADNLCNFMSDAIQMSSKTKGINGGQIVNFKTNEEKGTMISIKSGNLNKKGLVANFCPFCGGEIYDQSRLD